MKFAGVIRAAAAAVATGALLVTGLAPAQAAVTYPPHVSVLYASPFLSGGYATVLVSGDHLAGLKVTASRSSLSKTADVVVDDSGTIGSARVKVSSVLSSTAGRYTVTFTLKQGATVTATTTQSYVVGKEITIKSFSVTKKSYGLYIKGVAAKSTPVRITVSFVGATYSKTYTKTVYGSRSTGSFYYRLYKTTKGTYNVKAQVAPNTKYFSAAVPATYTRS